MFDVLMLRRDPWFVMRVSVVPDTRGVLLIVAMSEEKGRKRDEGKKKKKKKKLGFSDQWL